jgi:hypothetical protein
LAGVFFAGGFFAVVDLGAIVFGNPDIILVMDLDICAIKS